MSPCKHASVDFVGEQKTDDGVNTYLRCTTCGMLLVVTPERNVFGIPAAAAPVQTSVRTAAKH